MRARTARDEIAMAAAFAQLKKLRGRSVREMHERGRQELDKLRDRWFGLATGEVTDEAFAREIGPRAGGLEGAARRFAERMRAGTTPVSAVGRREEIASSMRTRFPIER